MSFSTRPSFSFMPNNNNGWSAFGFDCNSGQRGFGPASICVEEPWISSEDLQSFENNPFELDAFTGRMNRASFSVQNAPQAYSNESSSVPSSYSVALPDPVSSSSLFQDSHSDGYWSTKEEPTECSEAVSQTPEYFYSPLPSLTTSHDAERQQTKAKLTASLSASTGFACPIGGCTKNYRRKGDLKFHILEKHPGYESLSAEVSQPKSSKEGKEFPCPFESCKCGFKWERDLRRHFKRKHNSGLNLYPELAPQQPIITNETRFDEKNMCSWKCTKDSTSEHY